jgi:hypothetical protein
MTGERRTFNFSKLPEIVGTGEYFSKNGGKNRNYRYKSFFAKRGGENFVFIYIHMQLGHF